MKHAEVKFKQIPKTGSELQEKLVGGLILKMTTTLWILTSWKVFGGYLKTYGKMI